MLVVSPWSKKNYVDHQQADQTSVIRFIEDNWLQGKRLGGGSFDVLADSIDGLFDFHGEQSQNNGRIFLDPTTGEIRPAGWQPDGTFDLLDPFADQLGHVDKRKRR